MNILWDFDGTLVDSYRLFVKLFKKILADDTAEEEIFRHLKISFTHAFEHYGFSEELKEKLRKLVNELEPSEFIPFEDLEKVLELADYNFIVTHNSRKVVKNVLDHHGLTGHFTKIIGYEDKFPRKPDTSAYKHILKEYSVDVVVGDRELDLIPAKELGIATCSFQNDTIEGMDYYVHTYKELYDILRK
ncbi:HAD-IA family hydrolase [Pseudalkalibacillus sp. A8]|uniref:HAD-IA family hydrolase n=1 Tax=Pseudalkalibacillus sp. A8 TaxID=3382641 RepID=UPI0038B51270